MLSNEQIILNQLLARRQDAVNSNATPSEFFEAFTAEQFLKDFDLSYDQIDSGLVGAGGDGGIDGFYLFVNSNLVEEDGLDRVPTEDVTIDIRILQSKMHTGFQESPIERFLTVTDDILDLSRSPDSLASVYNERLLSAIHRFRDVQNRLVDRFPVLRIHYCYACKASAGPSTSVRHKVKKLENVVAQYFPHMACQVLFLGARELLDLASQTPSATKTLELADHPLSLSGRIGYACLVRLDDFYRFITTDDGDLRHRFFDSNVRDFQGSTEVNNEIRESLETQNAEDFWWLNNGISIVASSAMRTSNRQLTIEDPEIVNGLQTSTQIYNHFRDKTSIEDERHVLVKVLVPEDSGSRDRIIKATNRQMTVQLASLRSTDKIHRDIEQYLLGKDLYYDRRKNYYKNRGKPRDSIISIPYLAQSLMAIVLRRPDMARARPSTLLKKDNDYKTIFDARHPIRIYYVCAEAMRRVEVFLKGSTELAPKDRTNLRFYLGMYAVLSCTKVATPTPRMVAELDLATLSTECLELGLGHVQTEYDRLGGDDQVAKGPDLRDVLLGLFAPAD